MFKAAISLSEDEHISALLQSETFRGDRAVVVINNIADSKDSKEDVADPNAKSVKDSKSKSITITINSSDAAAFCAALNQLTSVISVYNKAGGHHG